MFPQSYSTNVYCQKIEIIKKITTCPKYTCQLPCQACRLLADYRVSLFFAMKEIKSSCLFLCRISCCFFTYSFLSVSFCSSNRRDFYEPCARLWLLSVYTLAFANEDSFDSVLSLLLSLLKDILADWSVECFFLLLLLFLQCFTANSVNDFYLLSPLEDLSLFNPRVT